MATKSIFHSPQIESTNDCIHFVKALDNAVSSDVHSKKNIIPQYKEVSKGQIREMFCKNSCKNSFDTDAKT